ncbi:MAG: hypothetical protein M0P70_03635 [Desulfobulbaceae bacterium]|nr:hypothetical protein [Desulfobulbaceae bacterium]
MKVTAQSHSLHALQIFLPFPFEKSETVMNPAAQPFTGHSPQFSFLFRLPCGKENGDGLFEHAHQLVNFFIEQ